MDILSRIAEGMQGVLTETADIIASETGFVKRHRKVTGSKFGRLWSLAGLTIQILHLMTLTLQKIDV